MFPFCLLLCTVNIRLCHFPIVLSHTVYPPPIVVFISLFIFIACTDSRVMYFFFPPLCSSCYCPASLCYLSSLLLRYLTLFISSYRCIYQPLYFLSPIQTHVLCPFFSSTMPLCVIFPPCCYDISHYLFPHSVVFTYPFISHHPRLTICLFFLYYAHLLIATPFCYLSFLLSRSFLSHCPLAPSLAKEMRKNKS